MLVANKEDCKLNDRMKQAEGRVILEGSAAPPLLAVTLDKWLYAERLDSMAAMTCN